MGTKKILFFANLKLNKDSYVESQVEIPEDLSDEQVNLDLINWVKSQIGIEYNLASLDASGNYTFDFNAIMNSKKQKGVYSVFCEEGQKEAEKLFLIDVKTYLLRDIVQYDKDELFDEE